MKQLLSGLAILMGVALTGCDSQDTKEPDIPSVASNGVTAPIYNVSLGNFPLPNDLLFSGTEDLTLNIPVDDETDFTDVLVQLSSIDGWSTSAPFVIPFLTDVEGTSLDESTLIVGETVRIFRTLTQAEFFLSDGDDSNDADFLVPGTDQPIPSSPPVAVINELGAEDFSLRLSAADPSGLTLEVVLLKPLAERTSYVVVLTNGIRDSGGLAVRADGQYDAASEDETQEGASSGFVGLSALISQIERSVTDTTDLTRDEIVLSMQFTTQSITPVFDQVNAAYLNDLSPLAALNPIASGGFAQARLQTVCGYIPELCINPADLANPLPDANLYHGRMLTPYFLESWQGTTDVADLLAPLSGFWTGFEEFGADAEGNPVPFCGRNPTVDCVADNPLGTNLTYVNTLPEIKTWEVIPVLAMLPQTPKPANGYPVVIFQHGITQNRTNALLMATTFAAAGIATVAIDLPLHGVEKRDDDVAIVDPSDPDYDGSMLNQLYAQDLGANYDPTTYDDFNPFADDPATILNALRERTFYINVLDANGALSLTTLADNPTDGSGAHYLALGAPLTGRDNNRQGVVDLMQLFRTIPTMDVDGDTEADFDADNISFMGHSLGGIIGSTFVANQPGLKAAIIANSSGHVARLTHESPVFRPLIQAGLSAVGIEADTPAYDQFFWLTQTVVDAGDPLNYGPSILTDQTPMLIFQNENDATVVNKGASYPLVGTETLASVFEAPALTESPTVVTDGVRGFLRYSASSDAGDIGGHGSILTPVLSAEFNALAPSDIDLANIGLTTDMKTAAATFIATGGTTAQFTPALTEEGQAEQ